MTTVGGVDLLDVREAAEVAGRNPETIRRWVWSGRLPARRQGRRWLVARQDVERLMGIGSTTPTLAEWARRVAERRPKGTSRARSTAADLVLADRRARDDADAGR